MGCFINQFSYLQVVNETTNIRTILFPLHKCLELCFYKKNKKNNFKEKKLLFFRKEILIMTILKLLESTSPFFSLLGWVESTLLGSQTQFLHKFYAKNKEKKKKKAKK